MFLESLRFQFKGDKMPVIKFTPDNLQIEVEENTKVLVAARKVKANIRFGCASCRCGTCAVRLKMENSILTPADEGELKMLKKLELDGMSDIRMACRTRIISGELEVDLDFQNEYEIPDEFEEG